MISELLVIFLGEAQAEWMGMERALANLVSYPSLEYKLSRRIEFLKVLSYFEAGEI